MMLTLMFSIVHTVTQNSGNCVKHMVHIFSQELFTVTCQTINVSEFRGIVFVFSLNNLLSQKMSMFKSSVVLQNDDHSKEVLQCFFDATDHCKSKI